METEASPTEERAKLWRKQVIVFVTSRSYINSLEFSFWLRVRERLSFIEQEIVVTN